MIDLSKHKLELIYPCEWCYKIVILDEHDGHHIAKEVFEERPHKVTHSKVSSKGKYKSLNIELLVHNDDDRTYYHKALHGHKHVKMVI
jgi:putative lipoic acid-binding regulatory protein